MFFSLVIYFYGDKGTKHFLISNKKCEPHRGRKLANEVLAAQAVVARRAGKISRLANLKISKCGGLEIPEGNGGIRKRGARIFDEKRV